MDRDLTRSENCWQNVRNLSPTNRHIILSFEPTKRQPYSTLLVSHMQEVSYHKNNTFRSILTVTAFITATAFQTAFPSAIRPQNFSNSHTILQDTMSSPQFANTSGDGEIPSFNGDEQAKATDFANYFCSYAQLYHQKQMLADHNRMAAYLVSD